MTAFTSSQQDRRGARSMGKREDAGPRTRGTNDVSPLTEKKRPVARTGRFVILSEAKVPREATGLGHPAGDPQTKKRSVNPDRFFAALRKAENQTS
jgi:hypothetical protein